MTRITPSVLAPCKKCGMTPNILWTIQWDTKNEVAYACSCDWATPKETLEEKATRVWNERNDPALLSVEAQTVDMDEDRSVLFELGRQEVEKEFRTKNLQQRVAYVLDMFRPESAISEISRQAALAQVKP